MGGKSKFTEEIAAAIIDAVAAGSTLTAEARNHGLSPGLPFQWVRDKPDFAKEYARARQARATQRSDEIDEIRGKILNGEIDSQAGRVAIDSLKWLASKEDRNAFGDKVDVEAKVGTYQVRLGDGS